MKVKETKNDQLTTDQNVNFEKSTLLKLKNILRKQVKCKASYQMVVQKEQCPWRVSQSFCDVSDPLFPVRSAVNHSPLSPACTSQMNIRQLHLIYNKTQQHQAKLNPNMEHSYTLCVTLYFYCEMNSYITTVNVELTIITFK